MSHRGLCYEITLRTLCKYSYASKVKPNCGLLLTIRAGPPLNKALKPSSRSTIYIKPIHRVFLRGTYRFSQMRLLVLCNAIHPCGLQLEGGF